MAMTACTDVRLDGSDDGSVHHYFGYVRLQQSVMPPDQVPIRSVSVTNVGVWYGAEVVSPGHAGAEDESAGGIREAGIGYQSKRQDEIPIDCRLVVRVATDAQLQQALQRLAQIGKSEICAMRD